MTFNYNKCRLVYFDEFCDERGTLASLELKEKLNFNACRVFQVYNVSFDRGGHAHRFTNQILIASSGQFIAEVFNGKSWDCYKLSCPSLGLYTPKLTFLKMRDFSKNTVCTVLSDTKYLEKQIINDLDKYKLEMAK